MANPWLVKAGAEAAKNPEGVGKVLKGIIIFIVSFFVLISAVSSSFISLLVDVAGLNKNSDPMDSVNVSAVADAYEDYMENNLYPEMERIREELEEELNPKPEKEENADIADDIVNEKPGMADDIVGEDATSDADDIVPEKKIEVNVQQNEINLSYVLAYLTHADDTFKAGKGIVDASDVENFFTSINRIKTKQISETEYMVYNVFASPEEVAQMYFPKDTEWYLLSFELYLEFIGDGGISFVGLQSEALPGEKIFLIPDTGLAIPKVYQNDYRSVKYGSGTISTSGCAPTSLAMVLSYLTDSTVTPADIVSYTGNRYYVAGSGSSWTIFPACASAWGFTCTNIGKNQESVIRALNEGKPVIVSVGSGTFTKEGHIMVIRGVEDGCFLINDPNKNNSLKYQTDKFAISTVMKEAKNFWSFS